MLAFVGKICFQSFMEQNAELSALDRAKEILGGNVGIARALGGAITPQAVSQWKKVPAERVLALSIASGVPCHDLRPDIFVPTPEAARASKSEKVA